MDTKLKSDIAESAVTTELLKRGFRVLRPIGDRLPYDLCVDIGGVFCKIQVKLAWPRKGVYIVDNRRTRTNRRRMIRSSYKADDFDFAILYIQDKNAFYIMPNSTFCRYGSEITLHSARRSRSALFHEAWNLLSR